MAERSPESIAAPDPTDLPIARRPDVAQALGQVAVGGVQRSSAQTAGPDVDTGPFAAAPALGQTAVRAVGAEPVDRPAERER
jgi:hypothetical protein